MGQAARCGFVRLAIAWASPAGQRRCGIARGASATSALQRSGRDWQLYLSGDLDRIQRSEMRIQRNALRVTWRNDPRVVGKTILLIPDDERACEEWAATEGLSLEILDHDFPAFADAARWIWVRRGLICDEELATKIARLRNRIAEAGLHSIGRDARGKLVPVVQPKRWKASSVKRSRARSDRIASARIEAKKRLATAQWLQELDRRAVAELESTGIPWAAVPALARRAGHARGLCGSDTCEAGLADAGGR